MSENTTPTPDYEEILSQVPNISGIRIDSLVNSLRLQRDHSANVVANISAELDTFKAACDHYYQMALGFQAQFALLKQSYDSTVTSLEQTTVERNQLAEKLFNVRTEYQDLKAKNKSIIDLTNSCSSLRELKVKINQADDADYIPVVQEDLVVSSWELEQDSSN